ncbi:hypothetical protein N665_0254s0007 [Sinapis alba]|nr:hypothetical protein N665_0254s0007 [Sinapis alba]
MIAFHKASSTSSYSTVTERSCSSGCLSTLTIKMVTKIFAPLFNNSSTGNMNAINLPLL